MMSSVIIIISIYLNGECVLPRLSLMEAIRVELSTKRDGGELYCSTENSFAVIAGRLARIDRTRQRKRE